MKKRLLALLTAAVFCFTGLSIQTEAWNGDQLDAIALHYADAVESMQNEVEITVDSDNVELLLDQIFSSYPVLYHYYDGCRWTTYSDRVEVSISLRNTDHPMEDIWVVGSDDELMAAIGLGLVQLRKEICFVTENGYTAYGDQINHGLEQLYNGYYLAYMGYDGYSSSYYERESIRMQDYQISFSYDNEMETVLLRQWRNDTEQIALNLAENLFAQDMPEYLKVLKIHDWIIGNARYNTANLSEVGNHIAYGAMVKGICVCMGYTDAAHLLLQTAGVENYSVVGMGTNSEGRTESHAWNAVKIDGDWYLIDTTWDDPTTTDGTDVLRYDYFLLTDDQLAFDHTWERAEYPVCSGGVWNAELALSMAEQDTNTYSDFNASLLVTQAEAEAEFQELISQGAAGFPIKEILRDETQTPLDNTTETMKDAEEQTPSLDVEKPSETNDRNWVLPGVIIAVVLTAIVVAAILIAKEKKRRQKKSLHRGSYALRFDEL